MRETGDGAATAVDLIDQYLDRIEETLGRIREQMRELRESDPPDGPVE